MTQRRQIFPLEDHQNLEIELFMGDLPIITPDEDEEETIDDTFDHPNTWFV